MPEHLFVDGLGNVLSVNLFSVLAGARQIPLPGSADGCAGIVVKEVKAIEREVEDIVLAHLG